MLSAHAQNKRRCRSLVNQPGGFSLLVGGVPKRRKELLFGKLLYFLLNLFEVRRDTKNLQIFLVVVQRFGLIASSCVDLGNQKTRLRKIWPQTNSLLKSPDRRIQVALVHIESAPIDVLGGVEAIPRGIVFRRQHAGFRGV